MNILINSYSLSIGGGQKILNDFLQYLQDIIVKNKKMMIFVFVPNQLDYVKFENKQLKIFELPFILKKFPCFLAIVFIFFISNRDCGSVKASVA